MSRAFRLRHRRLDLLSSTLAPTLLSRDTFRAACFERDGHRCVWCGATKVKLDAHHIIERRLWPDQGMYLNNAASLCDQEGAGCHMLAEQTLITPEHLRERAGITQVLLPPQFVVDEAIDKWGNQVVSNGRRLPGELFHDDAVQKVLSEALVLHLFDAAVKYPRTCHWPHSPGAGADDSFIESMDHFAGREVVVTAKLDGENTTMTHETCYARSLDSGYHPSRTRVMALHAALRYQIDPGVRICGENLTARHTIAYNNLPGPFVVFAVYDRRNICLSWDDTVLWAQVLDLPVAPVLYRGVYDEKQLLSLADVPPTEWANEAEGWVCRLDTEIPYRQWRNAAVKHVRAGHVQDDQGHWMTRTDVSENAFA